MQYAGILDEQHAASTLPPGAATRDETTRMRCNIALLIESSNVCPFVQSYDMYRCFYCQEKFPRIGELREHSETKHPTANARPRVKGLHRGSYVMVDVTNLKCRLCNAATPTVSALRTHLTRAHSVKVYYDVAEGLIPFKLDCNTFNCLICGQQFPLFQNLSQHMNQHYGDKVCEICGMGFLSHGRLKSHRVIHKKGPLGEFPCDHCNKVFSNERTCRQHIERVHDKKLRYRCPVCLEKFSEYGLRIAHMHERHDIDPPEYKCDVCGCSFKRPNLVTLHMRKCKSKNYIGLEVKDILKTEQDKDIEML